MKLLDGRATSASIKEEIAQEVEAFIAKGGRKPHLAAILVGENGASVTYVNAKVKACEKVGFESTLVQLPATISEEALLAEIEKLNQQLTGNMMEDMDIRDKIHNLEMKVKGIKPMDTRIDCVGCGS